MIPPPVLYKYAVPERIDVLTKKKIRFTQPLFLNDPFEFLPSSPTEPAPFEASCARKSGAKIQAKSRLYGVLSLSSTNDSISMWTHYADSHRGFAIGFDTGSAFFKTALAERNLRPVRYQEEVERISLTRGSVGNPGARAEEILWIKSKQPWGHEEEWRWLECRNPHEYSELCPGPNGELLYLRPFPPDSIQVIVLGCRADPRVAESIRTLKSTPEYKHLKVSKAVLSESCYKLEIETM